MTGSQAFLDKLKQWKASDQQKQTTWDNAPNISKQEIQQSIDAVDTFLALAK